MSLTKRFLTVGGGTLSSRFLGFFRDILMAMSLGAGPVADAFFVAFRLPNLFRRLFAEGAFNSAFVPLFSKAHTLDPNEGEHFAKQALSGLVTVLIILTVLFELAMPLFMLGFASGFSDNPEKFDLAVLLTRICFPYLLLVSMFALISGALNGVGRFAVAALAPTLLNVILIGTLLGIIHFNLQALPQAGVWLSIGVLMGGVFQLIFVWIALEKAGLKLRLQRPRWTPSMKRLVTLGIPGLIAGGITQINIAIGTAIATLQESAVSYLYYADRLYQLPLGIIGAAIGVVLLPELSRCLSARKWDAARHVQEKSIEFAMLLTLPAAFALFVLAVPIIRVLFEHGAFDAMTTFETAHALKIFALGLPAFVMIKILSPAFFAREDTIAPMKFAAFSAALNILISLALFPSFGHLGIASATTIAGWANAFGLYYLLRKKAHLIIPSSLWRKLFYMVLAALIMVVFLSFMLFLFSSYGLHHPSFFFDCLFLALLVSTGMISFFVSAHFLKASDLKQLLQSLKRKKA